MKLLYIASICLSTILCVHLCGFDSTMIMKICVPPPPCFNLKQNYGFSCWDKLWMTVSLGFTIFWALIKIYPCRVKVRNTSPDASGLTCSHFTSCCTVTDCSITIATSNQPLISRAWPPGQRSLHSCLMGIRDLMRRVVVPWMTVERWTLNVEEMEGGRERESRRP